MIEARFGSEDLFDDMQQACEAEFKRLAGALQDGVKALLKEQIECIKVDLNALRDENGVLDSERDPEFRERVEAEVESAKRTVARAQELIKEATGRSSSCY